MTQELKPCPFCGSDDVERIGFDALFKERPHIKCHGCGADVYDVPNVIPIWHRHDSMVQTWNTRAERTCRNTSTRLDESRFHCSECCVGVWVKHVSDGRDRLPSFCPNCGAKVVER